MRELIEQCTSEEREAVLTAAWIVAGVGPVRAREREVLERTRQELGLPGEVAGRIAESARGQRCPTGLDLPSGDAARRVMFHYVVQVAGADGIIAAGERQVAERLGGVLGLGPAEVAAEIDRFVAVAEPPRRSRRRPKSQLEGDSNDFVSLLTRMRLIEDGVSRFSPPPAGLQPLLIVATNLVPVVGVFFFDWEVFTIVFLYWLENVIVGFFNVLKMRRQEPLQIYGPLAKPSFQRSDIPFFIAHYGMFITVHGVAVVLLFLKPESPADFVLALGGRWVTLIAALAALVVEHGCSYYFDFVGGEECKKPSFVPQFMKPYGRLVVVHVTIIFGGAAVQELGSPRPALLLLIVLKTLFDLIAWLVTLPETGALGRIKGAFRSAAVAALVTFMFAGMILLFSFAIIGWIADALSLWLLGRSIVGPNWMRFGFGAAVGVPVLAAYVTWLYQLFQGSWRFKHARAAVKAVIIALAVCLTLALAAWPTAKAYRAVQEALALKAQRAAPAAPAQQTAIPPAASPQPAQKPRPPLSTANLCRTAEASSSSDWEADATLVAAKAFDGDLTTRWNSKYRDGVGAWLAARWGKPVTVQKIVVRERFDRISDFVIQRFDDAKDDWIDLMHVFGNRHLSSYSATGGPTGWGYWREAVEVDGKQLEDWKERVFGEDVLGDMHPVFTIHLPDPLIAKGIRLKITGTKHPSASICEFEAY